MENKRLFLSMPEEDLKRLDALRADFGMNRSQYVRYLISGQRKTRPYPVGQKKIVEQLSKIELDLKAIALKEDAKPEEAVLINSRIEEITALLKGGVTFIPKE